MNELITLTGATCGASCWTAAEQICRCSCGGLNHGCLKQEGTTQPQRMAKIDGIRYVLAGIGTYDDKLEVKANEFNRDHGVRFWRWSAKSRERMYKDLPAKVRGASKQQIASWPELASFRTDARWYMRPELLWIREDLKADFTA